MSFASYRYRAARPDGGQELGVLEAGSREAASAALARRGLFPIDIGVDAGAAGRRGRLPLDDLGLGLRGLAELLEAGLPLDRALAALGDLAPASWAPGLGPIRDGVRQGRGLASALAAAPLDIPDLVLGIIQAGEAGSGLPGSVRRAAELMESASAARAAVRSALAYPALLALAAAGSVALLVGVVIPRFSVILADLGHALPASTRFVMDAAATARTAAFPALLGGALLAVAWRLWTGRPAGRRRWHGLLLALPVLGPARLAAATARWAAAAAALLTSGVPVAAALSHAARTAGDAAVAQRLLAARESIVGGQAVARALEREGAATATTVRLVRAGEQTGRLAGMLEHAARLEAGRVERLVRSAVRLVEPALILGFALTVALVAAALLQAVYAVRPGP